MDIIVRKIARDLGISADAVLVGDVRDEMGKDMLRAVEKAVLKNQSRNKPYKILIHANVRRGLSNAIKTTVMVFKRNAKIPKMLGTICYEIDNRKGTIDRKWILPLDIPRSSGIITGDSVQDIAEDAKGMPILH